MAILFNIETELNTDEAIALYIASGIKRPTDQPLRMQSMLKHANLIVTARRDGELLGLARCLTDYSFVVYIADLLVDKAWQRQGIGARLLAEVQRVTGPQVQQLLLSAPTATAYYPQQGFSPLANAFAIGRKE